MGISKKIYIILLLNLIGYGAFGQVNKVAGKVIDISSSENILGATIVQKGTTNGTVSDVDGNFSLELQEQAEKVIIVSFVGYLTEELIVTSAEEVTIGLVSDIMALDEIVVVGYGTQDKKDVTGAVGVVSSSDFELRSVDRVENMLQGTIGGVDVTQNSGAPGAALNIEIRGLSSFSAGNAPLVVIDGIIGGNINSINPSDIETVSVLKDASSSAIYGAFGTGGVIIITTKRGKLGKPKLNVNYSHGIQQVTRLHDLMDAPVYMQAVQEKQIVTDGLDPNNLNNPNLVFTDNDIRAAQISGESTDWQDEIFQFGSVQDLQVSLSGADQTSNYYFSGGIKSNDGILLNTGYKRYNLRFKYSKNLSKKLIFSINLNNDYDELKNTSRSGGGSGIVKTVLGYAPTEPVYVDEPWKYSLTTEGYGYVTKNNPVYQALEANRKNRHNNLQGVFSLKYKLNDSWSFESKGITRYVHGFNTNVGVPSPNRIQQGDVTLADGTVQSPAAANSSSVTNSQLFYFQNTNQINYIKTINLHKLDAIVAYEFFDIRNSSFSQHSSNYEKTQVGFYGASITSKENESNGAGYSNELWRSYLARFNYAYANKYLLTLSVRRDGSSRLFKSESENRQWTNFASGSFGYRISEDFLKDVSWIKDLKLRIGYGQTGNRSVPIYGTQELLGRTQYSFSNDGGQSAFIFKVKNSRVTWETKNSINTGLDLTLLDERIRFTADYYTDKIDGLIFNVRTPAYFGGGGNRQNIGEMSNKGVDLSLTIVPYTNHRDFTISNKFNFNLNRNKLLKTDQRDSISSGVNDPQTFGASHWNIIGQELGLFKGLVWEGTIWQEGEDIPAYASVGDLKYRDVNGDNVLNEFDAVTIGKSRPDFTFGFTTDVNYKNWSLNIHLQGVVGRDVYNFGRYNMLGGGGGILNGTSQELLNRWSPDNTTTVIPAFTTTSLYIKNSTYFIEDGSFLKARNISLAYEMPKSILEKIKVERMQLRLSVQNAFIITKYSGYDPESFRSSGALQTGIDEGSYPTARTYSFGVRIGI